MAFQRGPRRASDTLAEPGPTWALSLPAGLRGSLRWFRGALESLSLYGWSALTQRSWLSISVTLLCSLLLPVVVLLLVNGVLGAVDTLWYHEHKARLAWHPERYRTELRLHAARDAVYAVLYGTIGWWAWSGIWAGVLAALLATDIVITLVDFVVEDRTRGLSAGERVLHSTMAILYGAMLMRLVPELVDRMGQPSVLWAGPTAVPVELAALATLFGVGIAASGLRDLAASCRGTATARLAS
jgi:hypothetical protein